MRYLFILAGLLAITLTSCNNNDSGDYVDESIIPPGQSAGGSTEPAAVGTQAPIQMQNPAMQPVQVNPQTVSTGASGKLNPKHGEPGHRCDIPEGAPLDSKPATTGTATTTTATPTITPVTTSATPAKKTAPGMNPPHGQPGHRCDIAEGAPLNSKPVTPPAPAQATPVQVTPVPATPGAIKAEDAKTAPDAIPQVPAQEPKKDGGR